ncbi:hypothetical protein HQ584_01730 [Patescibacteria group bacterium]|nr:hypothetical protein [Patescibacteria group bacterium]
MIIRDETRINQIEEKKMEGKIMENTGCEKCLADSRIEKLSKALELALAYLDYPEMREGYIQSRLREALRKYGV